MACLLRPAFWSPQPICYHQELGHPGQGGHKVRTIHACNDRMTAIPWYHSPQDVIKKLEKTVNLLIEESAKASAMGDFQTVLFVQWSQSEGHKVLLKGRKSYHRFQYIWLCREMSTILKWLHMCLGSGQSQRCSQKGEDAVQAEETGTTHRSNQLWPHILCTDYHANDWLLNTQERTLSMQVLFNLGSQYHACKNYRDALSTYLLIVKDKMFGTAGEEILYVKRLEAHHTYQVAFESTWAIYIWSRGSIRRLLKCTAWRWTRYQTFTRTSGSRSCRTLGLYLCAWAVMPMPSPPLRPLWRSKPTSAQVRLGWSGRVSFIDEEGRSWVKGRGWSWGWLATKLFFLHSSQLDALLLCHQRPR